MSEIEKTFDDKTQPQDYSTVKQRSRYRTYSRVRTSTVTGGKSKTGTVTSRSKSKSFSDQSILLDPEQWGSIEEEELIQAGTIIRNNYRLEEKIGEGGMGVVWKAVDLIQEEGDSRDVYVAIKFFSKDFKQHPDALKALVRESARYKRLIHSNIVKAYELSRIGDIVFIVMEFLNGIPLDEFIKQHPNGIPFKEAQQIIINMGDALAYAHQNGIAHLDFKPANVFYDPNKGVTKVIDFGIAQFIDLSEREKTKFNGSELRALTEAYASCEMLAELEPKPSDDIYALACVTYELLSGKHPFNKTRADQARLSKKIFPPKPIKGLKRTQYQALLRALAFERENRTPTADQFLKELLLSEPIIKKSSLAMAAGGIILLAAVFMAFIVINNVQDDDSQILSDNKKVQEIEKIEKIEKTEKTEKTKKQQLADFSKQYENCLHETGQHPVVEMTQCFRETLQKIALLAPKHRLLDDPNLPIIYAEATEQALSDNRHTEAEQLLSDWESLRPDDSQRRNALRERLIRIVEFEELSTALTSGDKARIESALGKLTGADEALRVEVLDSAEIREALLSYYMDESSRKAQNNAFPKALQLLDDALNILSVYPKAKNALTSHKVQLEEFKDKANQERLESFVVKLRRYLDSEQWLPDDSGEGIVEVLAQIKNIDPNSSVLKEAKLHQAFDRKIRQLVFAKGDTTLQIKDLFQAWENSLHFSEQNDNTLQHAINFVWLFYRKKGFEAKRRGDKDNAIKYFMFILELDWKKEVNKVMAKPVEDALSELMSN
jgi:serine/threonine protein kinase